ncbi:MAG: hypothetical protein ACTHK8_12220 [Ginsengibacter sp.]
MVLNEPMVFTGAGYFLGVHARAKKGLTQFLPAVHHASLCQAEGGRIIRSREAILISELRFPVPILIRSGKPKEIRKAAVKA